jgi:AcrR family transcriptional regulator
MSAPAAPGLREQKKARTRAAIAAAAAALFARDGYASVTMTQIAAQASVAEQTLYNYFPAKENLVFDRSRELESSLARVLAGHQAGADLAGAVAGWLDDFLLGEDARRAVRSPGGMPHLVVTSDALRRMLLDLMHQFAPALAGQLSHDHGIAGPAALAIADAVLAVFVRTIEQLGEATDEAALPQIREGTHAAIEALRPLIAAHAR